MNPSKGDQGSYRCKTENKLGTDSAMTMLVVQNSTRITAAPESLAVCIGNLAVFSCNAESDTALNLQIEWEFNGRRLDPSGNAHLTLAPDNTLTVNSSTTTELEDTSGEYTCVARTELDMVRATAKLVVQDVPKKPKITKVMCNGVLACVEWAPKGDNGSPILSYDIQISNNYEPNVWTNVFTNLSASLTTKASKSMQGSQLQRLNIYF